MKTTDTNKKYSGVWQLLKRNISKGQLLGYSLANVVGLTVVLVGFMFFLDSRHNADSQEPFFSNDYAVMSKRVDGIGFDPVNFSEEDIADLQAQPWVKRIGRFTASEFTVYGSLTLNGRGLSTYLFFESIPDEFFDVKPDKWGFDPESGFIPVVISKDYLTLYNFGFAVPQGLPQLSEDVIGALTLNVRLTGEGIEPEYFKARIVGFSQRLNTIAVPQAFMDWANEHFHPTLPGEQAAPQEPSRLIVEVDRMQSDAMNAYLLQHDIEVAGDKAQDGKISQFLSVVSGVVTINGVVICSLALFILLLSIFLLLQQSKEKLRNLMLLGYSPANVGRYYIRVVLILNVVITIAALFATFAARGLWTDMLGEIGIGDAPVYPVLLTAVAYLILVSVINVYVIRSRMHRIWQGR